MSIALSANTPSIAGTYGNWGGVDKPMISATINGVTENVAFSGYGAASDFSKDYFFNKIGAFLYFVG